MSLKEELSQRKDSSKIEFGIVTDVENTTSTYKDPSPKYSINVEIPEVNDKGECGDCPLFVHKYEDYMECVVSLAEDIDEKGNSFYGTLCPGKNCPRYEESQKKRKTKCCSCGK